MASTIDDFGGTTDPLSTPALGGPTGWAAAVRDYLKDSVVQVAGDTMTGPLTLPGDPAADLHAAPKQYVDAIGTWVPFTPTISGATTSAMECAYTRVGDVVHVVAKFTITAVSGDFNFPVPVPAAAGQESHAIGPAGLLDGSAIYGNAVAFLSSGRTSIYVRYMATSGILTGLSATAPFTWAAGDRIHLTATYRAA